MCEWFLETTTATSSEITTTVLFLTQKGLGMANFGTEPRHHRCERTDIVHRRNAHVYTCMVYTIQHCVHVYKISQ